MTRSILLDTHTFLWWIADAPQLTARARAAIVDPEHACLVSLVSVWEMAIKARLGKLALPKSVALFVPEQLQMNGFTELAIGFRDVARVEALPDHHGDPFDRLLVAQALERDLPIVTKDPVLKKYGVRRIW